MLLCYLLHTRQTLLFAICGPEELPTLLVGGNHLLGDGGNPRFGVGVVFFLTRVSYHCWITATTIGYGDVTVQERNPLARTLATLTTEPLLPPSRAGTTYDGVFHISDWMPTIVGGFLQTTGDVVKAMACTAAADATLCTADATLKLVKTTEIGRAHV